MKKKCTICGDKTENWEIVNGGPVRCWKCGKQIRESEKKEPRNFGTINFAPGNAEVWKAIDKCGELGHSRKETNIGRCLNRYTCDKCGFSYEIDSSD